MSDTITIFNQELAKMFDLFQAISSSITTTTGIKRMRAKIMGSVKENPEYAAFIVGPFITSNAVKIKEGDSKYFLSMNYGRGLLKLSQEHKFNYEESVNAIESVKKDFLKLSAEKQIETIKQCQTLMQKYVDHLIAKEKLKKPG